MIAITRRALRFLILLLMMWMGVTGAASARALHVEPGPGSTDAATTVVRYVYDVDAQHSQAARMSLTTVAGSAGRDQEGTQRNRGSDFWVAPRTAAESCLNSFTADTPVLMADGEEEPISEVKVGDKVLATDPETGRTEARPVAALIRHSGKHTMVDLTLSDGSKITTTDHHPFWDVATLTFTDAIDLHVGDRLLSDHGRTLTIRAERVYDRDLTAYNLQIDGIHTYYAGTTPVLVHNSCSQMNQEIARGKAPSGISRVDKADPNIPGNQDHVHFDGGRPTLNRDGTWGHGGTGSLTNKMIDWLSGWGWNV